MPFKTDSALAFCNSLSFSHWTLVEKSGHPRQAFSSRDSSNACVCSTEALVEPPKKQESHLDSRSLESRPHCQVWCVRHTFHDAIRSHETVRWQRPRYETCEPFHSLHPCFGCHGTYHAWCSRLG